MLLTSASNSESMWIIIAINIHMNVQQYENNSNDT